MLAPESTPTARPTADLAAVWRALPAKPLVGALLLVWAAFFHLQGNSTLGYIPSASLFVWLENAWRNSADDQHGYLIPIAVVALLWWRREELLALPKRPWWPALVLVALALALHALGFIVQQTRLSVVAFFAGLWALTGLAWGAAWLRAVFFPFVLFAFCVPLSAVADTLTFPLRMLATEITVGLSHTVLGLDILQRGTALLDPAGRFHYEVAAACSGIRSLAAISALAMVHSFMNFRRPWKRIVVVLSAIPLAVAANVVRLLMIIIAADAFGQQAGNAAHENAWLSLLPYVPAVAGLLALGRWLGEDTPPPAAGKETNG